MENIKSESCAMGGTVSRAFAFEVIRTSQVDCLHLNDIKSNLIFVLVSHSQL